MTRKKLAIVGGGVSVANLCDGLAATPGLPPLEICLVARNFERLRIIATHCRTRVKRLRSDWQLRAFESLAECVDSADIVILLIRVGGLAARARDEEFPARFGLQGDEGLGPGGMANALRTFPVLAEVAETIHNCAPECTVLNLIAPLGITTRQLLEAGIDTLGVCELPSVTRSQLLASATEKSRPDCLNYGGLNHLGWFWAASEEGEKALQKAVQAGIADALTFRHFGAVPLRYYYEVFDRPAARRLRLRRRPGRARELQSLSESVLEQFAAAQGGDVELLARRPTPWFDQAVIPIIAAMFGGTPYHGFGNLRNDGLLRELPSQIVVEVAATIRGREVYPIEPGQLPPNVADFLMKMGKAEDLIYECARGREPQLMLLALQNLPMDIPQEQLSDLAQEVFQAGNFQAS